MSSADYLRRQAVLLRSWARACFDLDTATRLRSMATDLEARAEREEDEIPPAYMHRKSGKGGSDVDRDN